MGQYSEMLHDKTDEELNEIFDYISSYTGEFIDNYLDELDKRRMLWDNKLLLSEKELIALTLKLESIPNAKYLNLLKRELEIRGLEEAYKQQKNGYTSTAFKTQGHKSNNWVYGIIIAFIMFASFLNKKLNQPSKQDLKNQINPTTDYNQKLPSINSSGSSYGFQPSKIDLDLPEITNKKLEIKPEKYEIPKIDKYILDDIDQSNELNAGFQKILDSLKR